MSTEILELREIREKSSREINFIKFDNLKVLMKKDAKIILDNLVKIKTENTFSKIQNFYRTHQMIVYIKRLRKSSGYISKIYKGHLLRER